MHVVKRHETGTEATREVTPLTAYTKYRVAVVVVVVVVERTD